MCILKADVERQRLRRRGGIFSIGEENDEILARPDFERGVARRSAAAQHPALLDQALEPGAGKFRQAAGEHPVEARAVLAGSRSYLGCGRGGTLGNLSRHGWPGFHHAGEIGQLRGLKIFVVAMGVMLLVGFTALIVLVAYRVSHHRPAATVAQPFAPPAIDIPRGARVEAMTTAPDRLILDLALPDGGRRIVILDLASGAKRGTIELRPTP